MYCTHCGKPNPDQSVYCAYCGKPISAAGAPAAPREARPQEAPLSPHACPKCGKDDRVTSVKTIFSGGVSEISYEDPVMVQTKNGPVYGTVNRTAVNYTALARRLAPPSEPENPGKGGVGCWAWIVAFAASMVAGFFGWVSRLSETLTTVIGVAAFFGVLVLFSLNHTSKQQQYQRLYPVWRQLMAKWGELYYCERDDVVYRPGEGRAVSADRINDVIYR